MWAAFKYKMLHVGSQMGDDKEAYFSEQLQFWPCWEATRNSFLTVEDPVWPKRLYLAHDSLTSQHE